ncbi:MAG: phospholipase D-like domain-containing protein [Xanthomonadales bacterium]|nr:phospholipase D-like domain-containing protein [Xanthomonadales bacterium]
MIKNAASLNFALFISLIVSLFLAGCATAPSAPVCPSNTQQLPDCPPLSAVVDAEIEHVYEYRTWKPPKEVGEDPVAYGVNADIPVQGARGKILGPDDEGAIDSLAAKLWMIENARHTIDFGYYIFKPDLVGYALMGAMCEAVKRGVDIRVMVDSAGSMKASRSTLAALKTCENQAGFMFNEAGQQTTRKARVQVMVFNAISKISTSPNRRSHDKLLIIDADFHDKALMMTGGRNISLDYYGLTAEGAHDPYGYRDSEILIRPAETENDKTIGEVSSGYYTLLFLYKGNKQIIEVDNRQAREIYIDERTKARQSLLTIKEFELLKPHLQHMDDFMTEGFRPTNVLLAHNLDNLTNKRVTRNAAENLAKNPNSMLYILRKISDEADGTETTRIVSPYLFLAQYKDKQGNVIVDEAVAMREWLDKHPKARIEIVTNSVLTSDNFPAQSVIDMDTAPRLLLDEETRDAWLALKAEDELGGALTSSAAWLEQVNHPRLVIYETGGLDSSRLGEGQAHYGKLHAKFFLDDEIGFVGTTNFDYRSRLYNSEMGYFFKSEPLAEDLNEAFDYLVGMSYRWGSPEWLELRRKILDMKGMKGWSTKRQRGLYKTLKATGLHWLF